MKTKILSLLLTLTCLLATSAQAQVNYAISGGTAYVTNSPNASGNIVIASTYNGYPVTSIGNYAFENCYALTSVTIPNSVTNIGDFAFANSYNLTNVPIPNSVTDIGRGAFNSCTRLASLTIPNSVTSIGSGAFSACNSLTSVTIGNSVTNIGPGTFYDCIGIINFSVDAANSLYSSLDGVLFNKAQTVLILFPVGRGGSYAIPNSVTSVGGNAFFRCTGLASVTIPNSVTGIGSQAFYGCSSLTSVTIGNSVTSIGDYAFAYCTSLMNLTFLGNAPSLSAYFVNVGAGAKVYYYYGTTGWGATYGGLPTVMLDAPAPQVGAGSAGVKPGGFGFTLNGVTNQTIVVEASTNLANWQPIWTNTLSTLSSNFVDPDWVNYSQRFYRLQSN